MKEAERDKAKRLAMSAAGAALEGDVKFEAREAAESAKTFTPGEGKSAKESFITNFTPEQKSQIRDMIANASSPAEIERIEASVKRGEFPVVPVSALTNGEDRDLSRKREAPSENGDGDRNGNSKKYRLDT